MSATDMFRDYLITRLITFRVAAVVLLVAGLALAITPDAGRVQIMVTAALATMLVFQFRLWDDLSDAVYDLRWQPARAAVVAGASAHLRRVVALTGLLALATLWIWRTRSQAGAYILLLAGFAVLYRLDLDTGARRIVRVHLVLTKYPVFVYLCSVNAPIGAVLCAGFGAYLALNIYELATDRALRAWPARRWMLVLEIMVILLIPLGARIWPQN